MQSEYGQIMRDLRSSAMYLVRSRHLNMFVADSLLLAVFINSVSNLQNTKSE